MSNQLTNAVHGSFCVGSVLASLRCHIQAEITVSQLRHLELNESVAKVVERNAIALDVNLDNVAMSVEGFANMLL